MTQIILSNSNYGQGVAMARFIKIMHVNSKPLSYYLFKFSFYMSSATCMLELIKSPTLFEF